jgi:hypothetical protein
LRGNIGLQNYLKNIFYKLFKKARKQGAPTKIEELQDALSLSSRTQIPNG